MAGIQVSIYMFATVHSVLRICFDLDPFREINFFKKFLKYNTGNYDFFMTLCLMYIKKGFFFNKIFL